jgi:hypothetical protein
MTELNNSSYYKKINEYNEQIKNNCYCFEVTKSCGYSCFVFIYKDQLVKELYHNIFHHFGCNKINSLYILDKEGNKILLQDNYHKRVRTFVEEYTDMVKRLLEPIYPLPMPVVYRLYLDDEHEHL